MRKIVIAYNEVSPDALPDELDILDQVRLVEDTLHALGYATSHATINFDLNLFLQKIQSEKPDLVFNLVESIGNHGELLYFAPALLGFLKVPYTGVHTEAMFLTTSKHLAKQWMKAHDIPTPSWFGPDDPRQYDPGKMYLAKPCLEDGSLGFDEDYVFKGRDAEAFTKAEGLDNGKYFVEEYLDGREFNISMVAGKSGPEILPVAEMKFYDFPENKPRILGYKAKWIDDSFEYLNTRRVFMDESAEKELADTLKDICMKCWNIFRLSGYARVDFRLDAHGIPNVLEINANPCITPGAGFYSACTKAGYSFGEITRRIIDDALPPA
ncbi:MAG: hypothetical protein GYA22_11655 [Bacteroidales bacterium]|nr:hypothetical protein [Bacteroidales bacterium]